MTPTSPSPSASAPAGGFDRRAALRSFGLSLTINALCPFLLYRALEPHFPPTSVMPLLYATIFPAIGLVLSLVRKRAVDAIAIIVMAGFALHIIVTLLASTVRIALVIRSLDGALIGLVFVVSAMIRRPIIFYIAKQAVAGAGRERAAVLNRAIENGGARTFFMITVVWGICLIAMSAMHVLLAFELPPADYLLLSPLLGVATILGLLIWSGRYLVARTERWRSANQRFDNSSQPAGWLTSAAMTEPQVRSTCSARTPAPLK